MSITRREAREQQAWNRLQHCRWEQAERASDLAGYIGLAFGLFIIASIAMGVVA